jgi:hypothetical protein
MISRGFLRKRSRSSESPTTASGGEPFDTVEAPVTTGMLLPAVEIYGTNPIVVNKINEGADVT